VLHVQFDPAPAAGTIAAAVNGANVDLTQSASTLSFASGDFASIVVHGTSGSDTLQAAGAITQPITFEGGAGADALHVQSGASATLGTNAAPATAALSIQVDANASLLLGASQRLDSLTVDGTVILASGGSKVLAVKHLGLSATGRLDLRDNDLIWDYDAGTPLDTATGWIAAGRNEGAWNGFGLATSMPDAQTELTTLGLAEAADLFGLAGGDTALYEGQTVDATCVIIKYTYAGDANLDGVINGDDYASIDFNSANPSATGYFNGDFNYDGVVNGDDYAAIDFGVNAQGAPL
jgi:hypothetical protein